MNETKGIYNILDELIDYSKTKQVYKLVTNLPPPKKRNTFKVQAYPICLGLKLFQNIKGISDYQYKTNAGLM